MPGITLQKTPGRFVRHSYPYPELPEVLYARATIPGVRVQHVLYPLGTSVSYVHLCHNTRYLWKFCTTSVSLPGTPEILYDPHILTRNLCDFREIVAQYPGYGMSWLKYPGSFVFIQVLSKQRIMHYDVLFAIHKNQTPNSTPQTLIATINNCCSCFFRFQGHILTRWTILHQSTFFY